MSIQKATIILAPLIGVLAFIFFSENNVNAENDSTSDIVMEEVDEYENDMFPKHLKYLVPPPVPILSDPNRSFDTEHVAYGAVDKSEELEQPIYYSHKLHAGEMQIECQYCHTYARRSIHAGIPSTQICMNCHGQDPNDKSQAKVSLEKDGEPRVELLKLLTFYYGRDEVTSMVGEDVAKQIPEEINWVIRVDGHTDNMKIVPGSRFSDNWHLSQARALSVVRYFANTLDIPPNRLAANGFGEYQPVNTENTPEARAQNRRIELKLTEK